MMEKEYRQLTDWVKAEIDNGKSLDNRIINDACNRYGIDAERNIRKVKEAIELALMRSARLLANSQATTRERYENIIKLYDRQPIVGSKKTLSQMVKQQYSTSLPVAFLMSEFVKGEGKPSREYFEPSAGNGFLTISLPQENTIVNEIDDVRLDNLKEEHFKKVLWQDGRIKFPLLDKSFDGVVMNPPFLKEINKMIFNALDLMKDDGRCAILRDDWNMFEDYMGTMQRKKNNTFFDKLFAEYNVVKIINLDASKVYRKQGTNFYMQIILIDGRRPKIDDNSIYRVYNPDIDKIDLAGFEELWEYFSSYFTDVIGVKETKEDEKRDASFNTDLKDANGETIYVYDIVADVKNDKIKYQVQGYDVKTSSLYCRNLNNLKFKYLPSKSIVLKEKDTHKFKKGDLVRVEGRDGVFVINRYDGDIAYPPHYTIKEKGSNYVDPIWVYERELTLFGVRNELQEKEIKLLIIK